MPQLTKVLPIEFGWKKNVGIVALLIHEKTAVFSILAENSTDIRTVLLRDLEPIQGRSLVDFPDYAIRDRQYSSKVASFVYLHLF